MTLKIQINMDNAAFEDYSGAEAARILRTLADRLSGMAQIEPEDRGVLMDCNGNKVGKWSAQ